jgi:hypothetical protein
MPPVVGSSVKRLGDLLLTFPAGCFLERPPSGGYFHPLPFLDPGLILTVGNAGLSVTSERGLGFDIGIHIRVLCRVGVS